MNRASTLCPTARKRPPSDVSLEAPSKYFGRPYLRANTSIWNRLPASLRSFPSVRLYGGHLQSLIQLRGGLKSSTGTFFFRNRPELELLIRLLKRSRPGSPVEMAILGCSKGAEVYSFSYAIRTERPDLNVRLCALDISKHTMEFAENGVYSLEGEGGVIRRESSIPRSRRACGRHDVQRSTFTQSSSACRRSRWRLCLNGKGRLVRVRPRFRDGITWRVGDANDPACAGALGLQDIVVANRFLCHMHPDKAEVCLRNPSGSARAAAICSYRASTSTCEAKSLANSAGNPSRS